MTTEKKKIVGCADLQARPSVVEATARVVLTATVLAVARPSACAATGALRPA